MANTDRPHGFVGFGAHLRLSPYIQDSGDTTAIFIGDIVDAEADGNISPAAAASILKLGASVSFSAASTEGTQVLVLDHPDQLLEAQDDGSATPAQLELFQAADHIAGAGNTTTKLSAHEIALSTAGATAGGFVLLDHVQREDNDSTAVNCDWVCQLNVGEGLLTLAGSIDT